MQILQREHHRAVRLQALRAVLTTPCGLGSRRGVGTGPKRAERLVILPGPDLAIFGAIVRQTAQSALEQLSTRPVALVTLVPSSGTGSGRRWRRLRGRCGVHSRSRSVIRYTSVFVRRHNATC